ncbi:MAG: single-stranded DNA-binding protein, partial [Victivallales bacterium]|nr:single-stranded DNA-binding protein [Victivallales bacterium]
MAASLNKVFMMGNLTRDPELRQAGGQQICGFGIALNRTYQTARGETREDVCYVDVEAWGRTADIVAQYARKGSPLFVEGRLRYDQWDDRETGKKRSRLTVTAENVQLLGGPRDNNGMAPQGGYA